MSHMSVFWRFQFLLLVVVMQVVPEQLTLSCLGQGLARCALCAFPSACIPHTLCTLSVLFVVVFSHVLCH